MEVVTSYCVSFEIRTLFEQPDEFLEGIFTACGRPMPPDEVRASALAAAHLGYKVFPVCDHHDAEGRCLGHALARIVGGANG